VAPTTGADLHLDVHETDDAVRVVADVPGVDKDAIDLKCDGEVLTIKAAADQRDYGQRVRLRPTSTEYSANATYNNGILEVSFTRSKTPATSVSAAVPSSRWLSTDFRLSQTLHQQVRHTPTDRPRNSRMRLNTTNTLDDCSLTMLIGL